jgi:hypothetical protein
MSSQVLRFGFEDWIWVRFLLSAGGDRISVWLNPVPFSLRESRGRHQASVLTAGLSIHEFFCSLDFLCRISSFSSKGFAAACVVFDSALADIIFPSQGDTSLIFLTKS